MRCASCGSTNPEGECSAPLGRRRSGCGVESLPLKAIEIARGQQAKSLELRATMSLARLRKSRGRKDEAQRMLAETYAWFTEGHQTPDLREAKALLAELA